jgi:DNA replication protein DnaT
MPRIRTFKPQFWGSPEIAAMSRDARLLALGLISFADDDGRFIAGISGINGYVFQNDNLPSSRVMKWYGEVLDTGFVHAYSASGVHYGCIPSWHNHQVINRYTPSKLPPPIDVDCAVRKQGGSTDV